MSKINWKKIYLPVLGFFALCWFIIRVIPKPSRAAYPCQQAAFPIASAFVIWLTGLLTSAWFFVSFRRSIREHKTVYALVFIFLFAFSFAIYALVLPSDFIYASNASDYEKAVWDENDRLTGLDNNTITEFDEVAIVKSSAENAKDIEYDEIEDLVRESIEMTGGIEDIITNGDYVVLKPNLVKFPSEQIPEYVEVCGMTTDWRVVKAVATIVRELNPDGKIYIIESASENSTRDVLDYYNYTLENIPEVDQVVALEDSCGSFEDYDSPELDKVFLPDSIRLYPDIEKPNESPEFYIAKIYNNADVVISIPTMKNHADACVTGGVKNVAIGMAPPSIYGMAEDFFGKWTKINHNQQYIYKWLHDFYLIKPVDFVVVDGLQGFDHGPVGVQGLTMEEMQKNMRLIIAGKKAVSVDAVCANIMSHDPTFATYLVYLDEEAYNVGTINSKFIRTKGEEVGDIRKTFLHTSPVATDAIYTDHTPPIFEVIGTTILENEVTLELQYDNDLNKVELEVNGVLLDQICVSDFEAAVFEVSEELLPVNSLQVIANDRFFNKSSVMLDYSAIAEPGFPGSLSQNYPNPFTTSTTIEFELKKPGSIKLYITDHKGSIIETLVNTEFSEGNHQVFWSKNVPPGTYIYVLEADEKKIAKQMIRN